MRIKDTRIEVKAGPEDGLEEGQFLVYPSTFTRTPDAYGDVIHPKAFDRTLKEWADSGLTMPGLYGHRLDDPDFYVASADETGTDDHGWWVKGTFDLESPKGKQTYRLVKGKRLNQLSFAFDVRSEGEVELEDGTKANELRDVQVYEFSFVPVGANQDTEVVAIKAVTRALAAEAKAGRVISEKNLTSLRTARDALSDVITAAEGSDEGKASTAPSPNAEEPDTAKAEEAARAMTARATALIQLTGTY